MPEWLFLALDWLLSMFLLLALCAAVVSIPIFFWHKGHN